MTKTKYPIYVPSLGRADRNLTASMLLSANLPFLLVVEKNDYKNYAAKFDEKYLLCLPGSDYGGVAFARNYIKAHARKNGYAKHWQLDDDIAHIIEQHQAKRLHSNTAKILQRIEKFSDLYSNIGITGLSANNFLKDKRDPYHLNIFAYTCVLISDNKIKWRSNVEDDLDYNLQVLSEGLCTIRFYRFAFIWSATGKQKGGYTKLYANRIKRQRNTMSLWPELKLKAKMMKAGFHLDARSYWSRYKSEPIPA